LLDKQRVLVTNQIGLALFALPIAGLAFEQKEVMIQLSMISLSVV
jgi:hypothetical protein